MKKTIITIGGMLCSGKSTTAYRLALGLKYKVTSTGEYMRSMAEKRGITLEELSLIAERDSSIDMELDEFNISIGRDEKDIILDSRLGFHFIPDSFKVFLGLDLRTAALRILNDKNRIKESHAFSTEDEIFQSITKRFASERSRYKALYDIDDHTDPNNFDLVIDTGAPAYDHNTEAVVLKIHEEYQKWLARD